MTKSCLLVRIPVCCCLIVFAATPLVVLGQGPGTEKEQDRIAREALERFIAVDFEQQRLVEILDLWSKEQGVKFLLHRSANHNNLDSDTLITLTVPEVRIATALSLMLDETECTWLIQDGIVQIVSDDHAEENMVLEAVDCAEVLAAIAPLKRQRLIQESPSQVPQRGLTGGYGGGVFSVAVQDSVPTGQRDGGGTDAAQNAPKELTRTPPGSPFYVLEEIRSPEEQLIDLIETMIDADSWEANGGTGRMQVVTGKLFVVTTCENQRRVKALLEELKPVNE